MHNNIIHYQVIVKLLNKKIYIVYLIMWWTVPLFIKLNKSKCNTGIHIPKEKLLLSKEKSGT